jgi:hypothetical protein
VDDYQDFLEEEGLLDQRGKRMAVIPCNTSFAQNLEFALYYEPPSRPCRRAISLIGAYQNKTVKAVGRLVSIAVFSFDNGKISSIEPEVGTISDEQKERLLRCISKTDYYDLGKDDLRVYFVDGFEETDLRKISPGGVQSIRYLDVDEMMPRAQYTSSMTTKQIADGLRGGKFE